MPPDPQTYFARSLTLGQTIAARTARKLGRLRREGPEASDAELIDRIVDEVIASYVRKVLNYPQRAYVARLVEGTESAHVRRLRRGLDVAGIDLTEAFD